MLIAGLTGGIASGKSTVSGFLKEAGAVIVDADKIARHVVQKGQPAWQKIVDVFGSSILLPDGEIDRSLLGDIIVKITMVDSIPPAPSGKFPFTISKVSPFRH